MGATDQVQLVLQEQLNCPLIVRSKLRKEIALLVQLRYGRQEGGKGTPKHLLACPPKLEGSGYVMRTATSPVTLVHGSHYPGACWSHSCTEASSQVKVESSPPRCGPLIGSQRTCSMTTEFLSALASESCRCLRNWLIYGWRSERVVTCKKKG